MLQYKHCSMITNCIQVIYNNIPLHWRIMWWCVVWYLCCAINLFTHEGEPCALHLALLYHPNTWQHPFYYYLYCAIYIIIYPFTYGITTPVRIKWNKLLFSRLPHLRSPQHKGYVLSFSVYSKFIYILQQLNLSWGPLEISWLTAESISFAILAVSHNRLLTFIFSSYVSMGLFTL